MSATALRTSGLTRVFQSRSGNVVALDALTLEIARGHIFGFLGPNGAGKTTTVRLLLGLLDASQGSAEVLGHDVRTSSARIRERAGALLEHDGLYERLSAFDNLEYYGRIWRLPAERRRARIQELLQRFGLRQRQRDVVQTWSRGMKRKLALARALLHRPEIIFLDEPTAGLDPGAAAALREDLLQLVRDEQATLFINTHNLAEAERLCDTIGVLARGRLVALGSAQELRRQFQAGRVEIVGTGFRAEWQDALQALPGVESAEISDGRILLHLSRAAPAAPVVRWLVQQGAEIEEVQRGLATLEDVYLQITETTT